MIYECIDFFLTSLCVKHVKSFHTNILTLLNTNHQHPNKKKKYPATNQRLDGNILYDITEF